MRLIPYADFVPEIALALGDIPDDVAENYVREAAIELCVRSQILVRTVVIDYQAGVTDYPLETDNCEQIISLQCVYQDGRICGGVREWTTHTPGTKGVRDHGHYIWYVPPDMLRITPAPSVDRPEAVEVHVAVAPTRDSCEVDALLYERYHEGVLNGALARLYAAKMTPWHDKQLAEYHRQLFDKDVSEAGIDRLTGGTRGAFPMRRRRLL